MLISVLFQFYLQGNNGETDAENRHMDRGGEEGEMYGKRNRDTYITICKIDSQREFAVWLRKLKQGLCTNLERLGGEGDGRDVQNGAGICIPMADSF